MPYSTLSTGIRIGKLYGSDVYVGPKDQHNQCIVDKIEPYAPQDNIMHTFSKLFNVLLKDQLIWHNSGLELDTNNLTYTKKLNHILLRYCPASGYIIKTELPGVVIDDKTRFIGPGENLANDGWISTTSTPTAEVSDIKKRQKLIAYYYNRKRE